MIYYLAFPPGHMIVDDNLSVLRRAYLRSCGIITRRCLGIDIDDLSVALILEHQPGLTLRDYLPDKGAISAVSIGHYVDHEETTSSWILKEGAGGKCLTGSKQSSILDQCSALKISA